MRRGALVEKAGREEITRELDAELAAAKKSPNAQDPNWLVRYVRVQHQNARGQGFDDVIVEFRGNPPKATIRIVEIKDYPGRYLQLSEMSALRENLSQNMQTLRERLQAGMNKTASKRPPEFQSLTDQEVAAMNTALRNKDVQVEVHVGPKTDVGSPNRKGSMLGKLRDELVSSGELGSDPNKILATDTVPITEDSIDRAANPAKTSSDVGR